MQTPATKIKFIRSATFCFVINSKLTTKSTETVSNCFISFCRTCASALSKRKVKWELERRCCAVVAPSSLSVESVALQSSSATGEAANTTYNCQNASNFCRWRWGATFLSRRTTHRVPVTCRHCVTSDLQWLKQPLLCIACSLSHLRICFDKRVCMCVLIVDV